MQRLKFFVEQWAWFVVRRQVRLIRKFRIGPSLSNRIESESADSNSNRISKLRRSPVLIECCYVPIEFSYDIDIRRLLFIKLKARKNITMHEDVEQWVTAKQNMDYYYLIVNERSWTL